jgi:hypothetical protein
MVHTGAKSRFGGRQDGFFRRSYHSPGRNHAPVSAVRKQAVLTVFLTRNARDLRTKIEEWPSLKLSRRPTSRADGGVFILSVN